jgi:hypothetical protein
MIPVKAPTPKPVKARPAYIIGKLEVVAVMRTAPTKKIAQLTCIARIRPSVSLDGQAESDPKKPAAR